MGKAQTIADPRMEGYLSADGQTLTITDAHIAGAHTVATEYTFALGKGGVASAKAICEEYDAEPKFFALGVKTKWRCKVCHSDFGTFINQLFPATGGGFKHEDCKVARRRR